MFYFYKREGWSCVSFISLLSLLVVIIIGMGCGDNDMIGVTIEGKIDQSVEVNPKGGDGDDDYKDEFETPSSLRIAMKSAKLFLKDSNSPSYTLFDTRDPSNPVILELVPGVPGTISNNPNYPSRGTYDRVRYEVIFYEAVIPVCEKAGDCIARRVRFYLSESIDHDRGQRMAKGDILIEDPFDKTFKWINRDDGSYSSVRPADSNLVYQVPSNIFPSGSVSNNIFSTTLTLSKSLIVPSSPSGIFVIDLTFGIKDLFFYDDTNNDGRFDPLPLTRFCDIRCNDGQIDGVSPSADFYPVVPQVTATVVK